MEPRVGKETLAVSGLQWSRDKMITEIGWRATPPDQFARFLQQANQDIILHGRFCIRGHLDPQANQIKRPAASDIAFTRRFRLHCLGCDSEAGAAGHKHSSRFPQPRPRAVTGLSSPGRATNG